MSKKKITTRQKVDPSPDLDLSRLPKTQLVPLLELLNEYDSRLKYNKLSAIFPETGPFSINEYPKHVAFMNAGANCKERAFFGANRSGKSFMMAAEAAYHLTGLYPSWWQGRIFRKPVKVWCASDTHAKIRDTAQSYLLGEVWDPGTGFVPKSCLVEDSIKSKPHINNGVSSFRVKHYTNGLYDGDSLVEFMSYEQGRTAFQGTSQDAIFLDEEPPSDIYDECLMRTLTSRGINIMGFTGLSNYTDIVARFLPKGKFPDSNYIPGFSRYIQWAGIYEVPHNTAEDIAAYEASLSGPNKQARLTGLPALGAGRVFTVPTEDFVIDPIPLSPSWPRFYGLDVSQYNGRTACVWIAIDPIMDTWYLYDSYKSCQQYPVVHASAIKMRGEWIRGACDPSAKRADAHNSTLLGEYRDLGLQIQLADNFVEAGLTAITNRLVAHKFFVFNTNSKWIEEYSLYRYNDKGEIAKNQDDDLMDATKYAFLSGYKYADIKPDDMDEARNKRYFENFLRSRDPITGY